MGHNELWRIARKGDAPGQNLVRDNAKRIEVALAIYALRLELFGGDILRGTHKGTGTGKTFGTGIERLGNTKIGQEDATV